MTIPVLIVPLVNRPDLLERMLASIDVPVGKIVIIDNSADGSATAGMEAEGRIVIRPHHNLGVAPSWNLGIRVTPLEPWWCIVNNDIVFAPGDLARVAEAITEHEVVWLPDMRTFGITPEVIERVGWFDENFVPGFYEDNDFAYRCKLVGFHVWAMNPSADLSLGSQTIRSDPVLARENNRTFPKNGDYYRHKWGGMPEHEQYRTPFNEGGDIRTWTLSMDRLRDLTWRV